MSTRRWLEDRSMLGRGGKRRMGGVASGVGGRGGGL
jgi:hypothetical protein